MDERQLRIALLRLLYESEKGQISRDRFVAVIEGKNGRDRFNTCESCHTRPGNRYVDRYFCVKCWPTMAREVLQ